MKTVYEKYQQGETLTAQEQELLMLFLLRKKATAEDKQYFAQLVANKKAKEEQIATSSNTETPLSDTAKVFKLSRTAWLRIAAVVLLALGVAWWQWGDRSATRTPALANALLKQELQNADVLSTVRGDNQTRENALGALKAYYESGEYGKALEECNKLLASEPQQINYLYAKALCQIQLQQNEAAITTLETVIKNSGTVVNDAKWTLALLYIQQAKEVAACPLLKELQENHIRNTTKLLSKLPCP
ncbi:MAG: hypothetical protein JNM36_14375 [Chitinophagales bacterium]|nr:hypothetical protein [Chitinophagales bacterium]HNI44295.1 CDC27 family protein [Chitinophagales bacterium]